MGDRCPFTDRQIEVLRYRSQGLTQQQVADIIRTSKANVSTVELGIKKRIRRAKETLEFVRSLDARPLCTLKAGTDLFDGISLIVSEAGKAGIPSPDDPMALINRIRAEHPNRIRGRLVKEDIEISLRDDGEIFS